MLLKKKLGCKNQMVVVVALMAMTCMAFVSCGKSSGKSEELKAAEEALKKDLDATPEEFLATFMIYRESEDTESVDFLSTYAMSTDKRKADLIEKLQDYLMDKVSAKELSKLVEKGKKKSISIEKDVAERVAVLNNYLKESNSKDFMVRVGDFFIQKTEVTQGLYQAVGLANPSKFGGNDSRPVECLTWYDAVEFCNWLSERNGLKPCYSVNGVTDTSKWGIPEKDFYDYDIDWDEKANGWRLPTEEEWNLAADDGHIYSGSDDINEVAWYEENSEEHPQKVAAKASNAKGIYDMTGNVWEWCWDKSNVSSSKRICRGGGWQSDEGQCAVSLISISIEPSTGSNALGFRMVRNIK